MIQEYLPILKREENGIRVIGKRERELCHGKNPVFHGTAVIAAVLPDGRLLLADKTEKQQKKRRREGREPLEEGIRIYDIFGGHMQYEHIPEPERTSFVSLATYQACALRELSEELLRKTQDGHFSRFRPDTERIKALGFYELSNDHNREYSWAFVYFLPDMGPYASQDTFLHDGAEEIIDLPVQAFTWKELLQIFHGNSGEKRLSDGIGRILLHGEGDKLHKIIHENYTE